MHHNFRSLKPPRRRATINMLSLPSQRFRRQATKNSLDLVGNNIQILS